MKAVYIKEFGDSGNLEIREVPDPPKPSGSQILVRVKAAALNRADLLQRRGLYPPPSGYSPNIPGLEFAGEVIEIGDKVENFRVGERVFGITAGEAQAELLLIDSSLAVIIPDNLCFIDAAAVPEAFITAHDVVYTQAKLQKTETLLVHAVGSGVGLAALQLAKADGTRVFGTSRTAQKLGRCMEFGLDEPILMVDANFAEIILEKTGGKGVDVMLDLVGAAYFEQNLQCLAAKGRLMLVGLTSGSQAIFDLGFALRKRLNIIGTILRSRSTTEKAEAVSLFLTNVIPLFENGILKPNVDHTFAFSDVGAAHEYLESNESFGKVILEF
ncbi:MAG: NAD(P)H-quinone oxidoreductase [Blastocatellia bacterium]